MRLATDEGPNSSLVETVASAFLSAGLGGEDAPAGELDPSVVIDWLDKGLWLGVEAGRRVWNIIS